MSLGIPAHPTHFDVAMGIIFIYQAMGPTTIAWAGIPYFSFSFSPNVIFTLMIVVRLTLHVEACAIDAVTSVLVLGLLGAGNDPMGILLPILPRTRVRAFP